MMIPTFIINLKSRVRRKNNVLKEFYDRPEFDVKIVEANEVKGNGALGLWRTILSIVAEGMSNNYDYILICEDDHQFTEHYSAKYLQESIQSAIIKNADVLFGGVSWFNTSIDTSENLHWVETFSGTQFTIIFKKFFKKLVTSVTYDYDPADYKIDSLTMDKLVMFPFISIQKDYGYSDATVINNQVGRVAKLFKNTQKSFTLLKTVGTHYQIQRELINDLKLAHSYDNLTIPTYIINLPERKERLEHITTQFSDKPEFSVKIIEAFKHKVGAFGLWLSIRNIIQMAIKSKEDIVIICEDDHIFTSDYSKDYLFKNIIEGNYQGINYLSGGTGHFTHAVPVTQNRYWVSNCLSAQFTVIYKRFFKKILNEPFDEDIIADMAYSSMTSNKMVLYPFISVQKDFGYSDVTDAHNQDKNLVEHMFKNSARKFTSIQNAYLKYESKIESINI